MPGESWAGPDQVPCWSWVGPDGFRAGPRKSRVSPERVQGKFQRGSRQVLVGSIDLRMRCLKSENGLRF